MSRSRSPTATPRRSSSGCSSSSTFFSIAFAVFYVHDGNTQLLGLSLGLAFLCAAGASVLAGSRLVSQEEHVETRPVLDDQERADEAIATYSEGAARLSRKRLLLTAATGAGGALAAALVVPAFSLGPNASKVLSESPWRRGRRVVDDAGRPIRAVDVGVGSFRTGFPEHASKEQLASAIVVVRIRADELDLPDDRRELGARRASSPSRRSARTRAARRAPPLPDVRRHVARAGAGLPLPLLDVRSVADGGTRTFGPAARSLPQLPLALDDGGYLVAGGDFSGRIGPSWWKVRGVIKRGVRFLESRVGSSASRQEGARLRLPRPLVVPARRDRALLLRRPRRRPAST